MQRPRQSLNKRRLRIFLANRRGMISAVEVHDSPLARVASDHLPIKAVISLETLDGEAQAHTRTA